MGPGPGAGPAASAAAASAREHPSAPPAAPGCDPQALEHPLRAATPGLGVGGRSPASARRPAGGGAARTARPRRESLVGCGSPAERALRALAPKGEEPRRLTVVTLVDGIGPGGGERLAAEVARRLDPDRYVRILCASRWDDEEPGDPALKARETLVGAGVRFLGLRRSSAAALWAWRPLVSLIRSEPVDIVHAHKFGS